MTVERWTEETIDKFAATVATAIAANNEQIRASNERIARIEQIQESNARAIAANTELIQASEQRNRRIDEELEELTAVTQAIGRDVAHLVATQQAAERERSEFRQAMIRFVETQEGVVNLLANLDSDRPTILRKLNAIENKVDRILDRDREGQ